MTIIKSRLASPTTLTTTTTQAATEIESGSPLLHRPHSPVHCQFINDQGTVPGGEISEDNPILDKDVIEEIHTSHMDAMDSGLHVRDVSRTECDILESEPVISPSSRTLSDGSNLNYQSNQ